MAIIDRMLKKLDGDVSGMQRDLQPESIARWYGAVVGEARRLAPAHLRDKISVRQDPVLPMRFSLDVSRRAVAYLAMAIDGSLEGMPYATRLYFLRVQEALAGEADRSLA